MLKINSSLKNNSIESNIKNNPIKNNRLLKTIWGEPVDKTPIWLMRQAGRYLPEYRQVRAQAGSFMRLCQTPKLACEVTLQPLNRYPLDAAILFSDILTIPHAMGLDVSFIEGEGPVLKYPIRQPEDLKQVQGEGERLASLEYVYESINLIKQKLQNEVPLIGFCGSPWTLAAYVVQGKSQSGFPELLRMMQHQPHFLCTLLNLLAQAVQTHLMRQIEAGVDVAMIFDTWGGLLSGKDYEAFSLKYITSIIRGIQRIYNNNKIPIIVFTRGSGHLIEQVATSGCDVLGLDNSISLQEARLRVKDKVLQGNLAAEILLLPPDKITQAVEQVLASYGFNSFNGLSGGHIFNLGHGITPNIPPEHVGVLVKAVHELSVRYHETAEPISS